jgi:hypothetical protein
MTMASELEGYLDLRSDEDLAREVGFYVLGKVGEDYDLSGLTHAERVIACLTEVEMEVNNGGFDQYFWNSPGNHAAEAVQALRELGALYTAGLVAEASAQFGPDGPDADRERRWKQMDGLSEVVRDRWSALDDRFYEYRDDLPHLAASYIRSNRDQFHP